MAGFVEVMKEFNRMCWFYSRNKTQTNCPMCESYPNCNIGHCRKKLVEMPKQSECVIMDWAAEHPESVYPTWIEWFNSIGGVDCGEPIPAEIAEKLGLEPKEE